MIKLILVVLFLLSNTILNLIQYSTNTEKEQIQESIQKLISIYTSDCNSCEDCVKIDSSLIDRKSLNKLFSMYIYESLIGGYSCPSLNDSLNELFEYNRFQKIILMFFNPNEKNNIELIGNRKLDDLHIDELVYGIKNIYVLHEIANELLIFGNTTGLEALWDDAKLANITNYDSYLKTLNRANFFVLADQIAFLHNIQEFDKRNELIDKASKFDNFKDNFRELTQLLELQKFDLTTYKEAVYGGM